MYTEATELCPHCMGENVYPNWDVKSRVILQFVSTATIRFSCATSVCMQMIILGKNVIGMKQNLAVNVLEVKPIRRYRYEAERSI